MRQVLEQGGEHHTPNVAAELVGGAHGVKHGVRLGLAQAAQQAAGACEVDEMLLDGER